MITIIIFISSLFITSALIAIKALELKSGKKNMILELVGRFDSSCNKIVSNLKFRVLQTVQIVRYIIFVQSKIFVKDFLYKIEEKIVNEFKVRQNLIMTGQKNIVDRGSASFYLKKITEDKSNNSGGKIEDSLLS